MSTPVPPAADPPTHPPGAGWPRAAWLPLAAAPAAAFVLPPPVSALGSAVLLLAWPTRGRWAAVAGWAAGLAGAGAAVGQLLPAAVAAVVVPAAAAVYHRFAGPDPFALGLRNTGLLVGLVGWAAGLAAAAAAPAGGVALVGAAAMTAAGVALGSAAGFGLATRGIPFRVADMAAAVTGVGSAAVAAALLAPVDSARAAIVLLTLPLLVPTLAGVAAGPGGVYVTAAAAVAAGLIGNAFGLGPVAYLVPEERDAPFALYLYLGVLVTAAAGFAGAVRDQRAAAAAVARSEQTMRAVFEAMPVAVRGFTADGVVTFWNAAAGRMFGCPAERAVGRPIAEVLPDDPARRLVDQLLDPPSGLTTPPVEWAHATRTGAFGRLYSAVLVLPRHGGPRQFVAFDLDLTDRARAEETRRLLDERLTQAQKVESLAVLAGGVAHDFNNLLTGILGYADLTLLELSPTAPGRAYVDQIVLGARRAADLAKQMLAYSGKGRFLVQPVSLSALIEETSHLLQVSISKKCVLQFKLVPDLPPVHADPTQMRQVVMNLLVNASEAIGDRSGVIALSTGVMDCDKAYLAETYLDEGLPPGAYVYLEVTDTGCGMGEETQAKIFDPFFTTKMTGRGLGLAAVLGIVRGHRGAVKVYSERGKGTTFKVLFPVAEVAAAPANGAGPRPAGAWRGAGTALVVDDEETVRALAKVMLAKMGFAVQTAADGREAVEAFRRDPAGVRLVLLDMTMPHLSGEETFRELRRIRADVKVVLSSGYNEQSATSRFAGKGLAGFIQKPYRFDDLREVVRKALGE